MAIYEKKEGKNKFLSFSMDENFTDELDDNEHLKIITFPEAYEVNKVMFDSIMDGTTPIEFEEN